MALVNNIHCLIRPTLAIDFMKPEAQRIAIAEFCGWKRETRKRYAGMDNVKGWGLNTHLPLGSFGREFIDSVSQFPDYLSDLNAISEVEQKLDFDQAVKFRFWLSRNSSGPNAKYKTVEAAMCHATAQERCDAMVKVIQGIKA